MSDTAEKRRLDTRRKAIAGALFLRLVEQDFGPDGDAARALFRKRLPGYLTREIDGTLFASLLRDLEAREAQK
ncbi:hypothetical protein [Castellaniella sp.]|uniref:hypothetical protein n=1 Tax=Castellaniella sp. TaxID=1955812 RepID=UPI002AFED318|nr:hypothetical protein [Castellaniella sp.]